MANYSIELLIFDGKWWGPSRLLNDSVDGEPKYDLFQSAKALGLTALLILLFFKVIPKEVSV